MMPISELHMHRQWFALARGSADDDLVLIVDALERARNRISIVVRPDIGDLHPDRWGMCVGKMNAREWRAATHKAAPYDLQSLGIAHAWTKWNNACAEIRRVRTAAFNEVEESMALLHVGIEGMKAAAERECADWPTTADLHEASLRLRGAA